VNEEIDTNSDQNKVKSKLNNIYSNSTLASKNKLKVDKEILASNKN